MAYNPVASQFLDMLQSGQLNGSFQGGPQNQMGRRRRQMAPDTYMGQPITPEMRAQLRGQYGMGSVPQMPHTSPPQGGSSPPPPPPLSPPPPTPGMQGGFVGGGGALSAAMAAANQPGPTSGQGQPVGGGVTIPGSSPGSVVYVDPFNTPWYQGSDGAWTTESPWLASNANTPWYQGSDGAWSPGGWGGGW